LKIPISWNVLPAVKNPQFGGIELSMIGSMFSDHNNIAIPLGFAFSEIHNCRILFFFNANEMKTYSLFRNP
jgi:hypothetical protein